MTQNIWANAGIVPTEAECRELAQARANALNGPVYVLQHVGGVHPKTGPVPATRQWMWRDAVDSPPAPSLRQPLPPPPRFWSVVDTIQPSVPPAG